MDLGIRGRKAIVCASSQGLGMACAAALAAEGCDVTINGRDAEKLERTARAIADSTGARVQPVAADIETDEGRRALVDACPDADILVTNNAGPKPGAIEDWDRDAWIAALDSNLLAPALMIRAVLPGMKDRRFGRIVNITSAMVKSPGPEMGLSTAPRAGLTALCKSISRIYAPHNITINNILPYRIDTDRQKFFAQRSADRQGISLEAAVAEITDGIAAKRLGTPEEFGATCAFLCSSQAGFISGQNIQLDGGSYMGLI
jgi:3-oxoacyl-[acyl-carrier protein] reductase